MDSRYECSACLDMPIGMFCNNCEREELRWKIQTLIVNKSDSHVDVCSGCVKIIITNANTFKPMCYCQQCYEGYCDDCYSKFFSKMLTHEHEYDQFCNKCWPFSEKEEKE